MESRRRITLNNVVKTYNMDTTDGAKPFNALDGISLTVEQGDRVGIIGSNGAGKSTLLNIISSYTSPTNGTAEIEGRVTPIMDIGTSVHPEATGRENIYRGGELNGLDKSVIDEKVDEIIEFVDLGEYIDMPVKTYSSGMVARLAFSFLFFLDPDILIIDEVLGVGDADFSEKSVKKTLEVCEQGNILLIVSHSLSTIQAFANRCIWMEHGQIMMDGEPEEVTDAYRQSVYNREAQSLKDNLGKYLKDRNVNYNAYIDDLTLTRMGNEEPTVVFELYDDIQIHIACHTEETLESPDIVLKIESMDGIVLQQNRFSIDSGNMPALYPGKKYRVTAFMPDVRLKAESYLLGAELYNGDVLMARRMIPIESYNNQPSHYRRMLYFTEHAVGIKKLPSGEIP